MYFSRGFVFGVFLQIRSVVFFFLQQYSNTASQYLTETRLQQKAGLISRCQSELCAVHSLGPPLDRGFDVVPARGPHGRHTASGQQPSRASLCLGFTWSQTP